MRKDPKIAALEAVLAYLESEASFDATDSGLAEMIRRTLRETQNGTR